MRSKCIGCPFSNVSHGIRKTIIMCIMPVCLREYDKKMRNIKEEEKKNK